MTVTTEKRKDKYTTNGTTVDFAFTFAVTSSDQVFALTVDIDGNETDYTNFTLVLEEVGGTLTTGDVLNNVDLLIYRDTPLTQEVDYQNGGRFPANSHEQALDKLTLQNQDQQEELSRTVKSNIGTDDPISLEELQDSIDERDQDTLDSANSYTDSQVFEAGSITPQTVNKGDEQVTGLKIHPIDITATATISDTVPVGTTALRDAVNDKIYIASEEVSGEIAAIDFVAGTATVGGVGVTLIERVSVSNNNLGDYTDITFASVSDMVSGVVNGGDSIDITSVSEGTKVSWMGYYERSDGGSNWGRVRFGAHVEDGGSIFSIDANTYIQANHGNVRINIKKFGAKGDGVDDTQSILNAASFSKNLKVPIGDFVLSGSALEYMTKNDVSITGYGDGSLLRRTDAGNVIYIDGCNRVNVSKVQVNGLFSYVSGSGAINLTNCTSFNIRNNYVSSSSRQGIKTENCQYGTIRGNRVTGCYQDGIMVRTESRRVTVVGNVCWNNGDPSFATPIGEGIHLFAVQDCVVNANVCYANNDNGIALEGADNCVITGNSCSANVVAGISLNKEDVSSRFNGGTVVSGNTCQDNGTDGIGISACQDMIVSGNTCTENTGYGINQGVDSAVTQYRVTTLNNIIRGNGAGGIIHNWNNEDCQIKGNTLRGSVGNGILINRPQSIDTVITGNNIKGFAGSQIQDNGTNSVVKDNQGFVTENKGTISFSDVSTAEFVNHGLDYTPDVSDISAFVSSSSTTNPIGNIRIYSPNATQFIIGFDNAAGAGGVDISWSVRRV